MKYYPTVTPLVPSFPQSEDQKGIMAEIRTVDEKVFTLYAGDKDGTLALATCKDPTDLRDYAFDAGAQSVRLSFDLKIMRNA